MTAPGTVPRARAPRGRRPAPPLVVTSERVEHPPAPAGRPPEAAPTLDVPAPDVCEVTGMTPEEGSAPTGELVLAPAPQVPRGRGRRTWVRLVRLVSGRPSGRHRPGTLDTGWSMFAPQRPGSGRRRSTVG